jgi:hypothetical protein
MSNGSVRGRIFHNFSKVASLGRGVMSWDDMIYCKSKDQCNPAGHGGVRNVAIEAVDL